MSTFAFDTLEVHSVVSTFTEVKFGKRHFYLRNVSVNSSSTTAA